MPRYTLSYFNFRARAELARLLFAVAGEEYEDERVQVHDWPSRKPSKLLYTLVVNTWASSRYKDRLSQVWGDRLIFNMGIPMLACPFGQLPILTVDGIQVCQSNAISRYLAREFGFAGKTSLEQARADMVVECVDDMLEPIMPAFREKNQDRKMEMRRNYEQELPVFMDMMEKLLISNNDGNDFFVGDELTWCDLSVMNAWYWIPGFGVYPNLDNYPKLKAHKERIESIPEVAEWIERRPVTPV